MEPLRDVWAAEKIAPRTIRMLKSFPSGFLFVTLLRFGRQRRLRTDGYIMKVRAVRDPPARLGGLHANKLPLGLTSDTKKERENLSEGDLCPTM